MGRNSRARQHRLPKNMGSRRLIRVYRHALHTAQATSQSWALFCCLKSWEYVFSSHCLGAQHLIAATLPGLKCCHRGGLTGLCAHELSWMMSCLKYWARHVRNFLYKVFYIDRLLFYSKYGRLLHQNLVICFCLFIVIIKSLL